MSCNSTSIPVSSKHFSPIFTSSIYIYIAIATDTFGLESCHLHESFNNIEGLLLILKPGRLMRPSPTLLVLGQSYLSHAIEIYNLPFMW